MPATFGAEWVWVAETRIFSIGTPDAREADSLSEVVYSVCISPAATVTITAVDVPDDSASAVTWSGSWTDVLT